MAASLTKEQGPADVELSPFTIPRFSVHNTSLAPECLSLLSPFRRHDCCPLAGGVTCPDLRHCCPEGTTCDADKQACISSDGTPNLPWADKTKATVMARPLAPSQRVHAGGDADATSSRKARWWVGETSQGSIKSVAEAPGAGVTGGKHKCKKAAAAAAAAGAGSVAAVGMIESEPAFNDVKASAPFLVDSSMAETERQDLVLAADPDTLAREAQQ